MAPRRPGESGQLRIIGGRWRGRKLRFRAAAGLRPTPDRVRETLFNWLAPQLTGARVLDLFAGSGALGLEAMSRGAAGVQFVDSNRRSIESIRNLLAELGCEGAICSVGDALKWLDTQSPQPFDIVFMDPPFGEGLLEPAAAALESGGWLAAGAMIYLEASVHDPAPRLPDNWQPHREKSAGDVRSSLFVRPN